MSTVIDETYINSHLIDNRSLFNYIYIVEQQFDIIPNKKNHYGVCIDYQDIKELRKEFLEQLYDSIVDWVYSTEKYNKLKNIAINNGKTDAASANEVFRRAVETFRANRDSKKLLIQGQLGELLLFHFIQRLQKAIPLLRKMKITTSSKHERFGADAIHFKYNKNKPIIILGEAKTYTSKYKFNEAFEDAITSILYTYENHRNEINSYVHEDFLDSEMNGIAEQYTSAYQQNHQPTNFPHICFLSLFKYYPVVFLFLLVFKNLNKMSAMFTFSPNFIMTNQYGNLYFLYPQRISVIVFYFFFSGFGHNIRIQQFFLFLSHHPPFFTFRTAIMPDNPHRFKK